MTRFAMVLNAKRCVDCKACSVACTAENRVPIGKHRNWIDRETRGRFPEVSMHIEPSQCQHCDNPPCVRVCPTGASHVREASGGIVMVDPERCIGCRYCMLACPYDARYFDEETGVVSKCTFCIHRIPQGKEPACVETCPTKVRTFGDLDDPDSEVSRLKRLHETQKRKTEAGTGPNLYYIIE